MGHGAEWLMSKQHCEAPDKVWVLPASAPWPFGFAPLETPPFDA
jgi:hypothetical protein